MAAAVVLTVALAQLMDLPRLLLVKPLSLEILALHNLALLPGAALLAVGVSGSAGHGGLLARSLPMALQPRALPWLHLLGVVLLGVLVTRFVPMTDDEGAYVFQAHQLLQGRFTSPALVDGAAIGSDFVIPYLDEAGQPRWTGVYPLLVAIWTAPGLLLGFPNLLWVPVTALIVHQGARLAADLWRDPDAEAATALLLASSPTLLLLGTAKHSSMLTALLLILAGRLALRRVRALADRGDGAAVALGLVLGLTVLSRPLDGVVAVLVGGVCVIGAVGRRRGWSEAARAGAGIALGGVLPLVLWLAHMRAVSGRLLGTSYDRLEERAPVYGFGETAYGTHDLANVVWVWANTLLQINVWSFGWPLALPAFLGAAWVLRDRPAARVIIGLVGVHLLIYVPAPFGEAGTYGVTYSLPRVVALALLAGGLAARDLRVGRLVPRVAVFAVCVTAWVALPAIASSSARVQQARQIGAQLAAEHGPVLIVYEQLGHLYIRSVVFYAEPPLTPDPEVYWYRLGDRGEAEILDRVPDRPAFRVGWAGEDEPTLQVQRLR